VGSRNCGNKGASLSVSQEVSDISHISIICSSVIGWLGEKIWRTQPQFTLGKKQIVSLSQVQGLSVSLPPASQPTKIFHQPLPFKSMAQPHFVDFGQKSNSRWFPPRRTRDRFLSPFGFCLVASSSPKEMDWI
jgi:hypothetical protein